MNNDRRKEIAKALALIEEAKNLLETARDDEQAYYDNMPESFQAGDKGDRASAAADALSEAYDNLEAAIDSCNTSTGD